MRGNCVLLEERTLCGFPESVHLSKLAVQGEIFRKGSGSADRLSLSKWMTTVLFIYIMNILNFRGLISLTRVDIKVVQQNGLFR